jgi:plasmid replication initiation protein
MERKLRQHNLITEARYDMSAIEKNIFYLLMSALQADDPPQKSYIIDITTSTVLRDISIEELRQAARNLITRVYYIDKPNGNILSVTLMTVVSYDEQKKEMRIVISQKLLPYLIALKEDYTEFELDIALSLRSKYAKRIYEMLSQHKDIGTMKVSVDELKYRLALKDPKTQKEQYKSWTTFKATVLDRSQKELEKYSDLNFNYESIKTGKKYTDLVFQIIRSKSFQSSFFHASN